MLPCSNRGAGGTFNFPDVCLTPMAPAPVPIPYPNFAFTVMAAPFAVTVFVTYMNAVNMGSLIMMSTGDEGGVAHPLFKQFCKFTLGIVTVFIGGLPGITLGCPTMSNGGNAPLGAVLVPSVTTVFLVDAECEARALGLPMASGISCDVPGQSAEPAWRAMTLPAGAIEEFARPMGSVNVSTLEGGVGHIKLTRISLHSASRVGRALDAFQRDGAPGVILDLRGNPGGALDDALRIAEELLPRAATFVRLEEVDGDVRDCVTRHAGNLDLPLWVLVDGATASAAELLAASLQWHGRARIVGAKSYGKWRGQVVRCTPQGFIYADAFRCLLPNGEPLVEGLEPDCTIEPSDHLDVALETARAALSHVA